MAKKKTVDTEVSPDDLVQRVLGDIHKQYGDDVGITGNKALAFNPMVIPWSPTMDIVTSGGIVEGSWVGITGHEKTGKSTTVLSFCANAQQERYGKRTIVYLDAEYKVEEKNLRGIEGLRLDDQFILVRSSKGNILSAEDFLNIGERCIKEIPGCVLVIDSISSLCESKVMEEGLGTQTRGGGAKILTQFIDLVSQTVPVNGCIVIGITHLISNTSGMGAHYNEKAARAWKYQCQYQLKTRQTKSILVGERPVGMEVNWECFTSRLGPPGLKMMSTIRFGTGVDRLSEAMTIAMDINLIKKGGAWYTLSFMKNHLDLLGVDEWNDEVEKSVKAQGQEKAYQLLKSNPAWAEALEREVLQAAGLA